MERNHEDKSLHLDFRDTGSPEREPLLHAFHQVICTLTFDSGNLFLRNLLHVLLDRLPDASLLTALNYVTLELRFDVENEALREAQFLLIGKLRQASMSPFREDSELESELEAEWEAEWEAEREAEWEAEQDAAIAQYLRRRIEFDEDL